jgi:hypothetical protein
MIGAKNRWFDGQLDTLVSFLKLTPEERQQEAIMLRLCILCIFSLFIGLQVVRADTINILMIEFQLPLVNMHIAGYEAITGHKVNFIVHNMHRALSFIQNFFLIGQFNYLDFVLGFARAHSCRP